MWFKTASILVTVCWQISLLVLHFPQVRLVWSRDASATGALFLALKQLEGQGEPDLAQAVVCSGASVCYYEAQCEIVVVVAQLVGNDEDPAHRSAQGLRFHEATAAVLQMCPRTAKAKKPKPTKPTRGSKRTEDELIASMLPGE